MTIALADDLGHEANKSRVDRLVEIVDHCEAAKALAESIDDRFLTYMLSMTIQAARIEMQPKMLRVHKDRR